MIDKVRERESGARQKHRQRENRSEGIDERMTIRLSAIFSHFFSQHPSLSTILPGEREARVFYLLSIIFNSKMCL